MPDDVTKDGYPIEMQTNHFSQVCNLRRFVAACFPCDFSHVQPEFNLEAAMHCCFVRMCSVACMCRFQNDLNCVEEHPGGTLSSK